MTVTVKNQKPSAIKKASKGKPKAEKIFHPASRKAGQMERNSLRKQKMGNQLVKRNKKHMAQGMSWFSCSNWYLQIMIWI
jgi:hypothetical protein